jgi:toxin FitB
VAEIRYGLEQLPDGRRKDSLLATATEVFAAFSEFIQPFDADAAAWYATIVAGRDRLGLPMDGFDAQIAAICRTRGAALATRNAKDFRETGIDAIDPWHEGVPPIAQWHRQAEGNRASSRLLCSGDRHLALAVGGVPNWPICIVAAVGVST